MAQDRPQTPARGLYAALLTPRKAGELKADVASMLDYLDCVTQAGVDGLVLFGATGEFVQFELEERIRVAHLAIRRSRVPVLVNVSYAGMAGVLTLAESALFSGAAGLLLMPPYFYRYREDDISSFYENALNAIGHQLPIYLYNLPQFTNPLTASLARKLLVTPPIAGIKDSSGDLTLFEALKALRAEQPFSLLVGNENVYLQERLSGANGTVSGIAAALPELMVALERAVVAGDLDRAHRLDAKLREFLRWLEQFPATAAIKQTASFRGWIKSDFPFPPSAERQEQLNAFRSWLRDWLPEVLSLR